MNRTALSECRKLLRLLECDVVAHPSDQHLYETLILSEKKKSDLLNWLFQHLYVSDHFLENSFEDILSMFVPRKELKDFLKGTMAVTNQFKSWKLLMSFVYQRRFEENCTSQDDIYNRILSGKLLDEYIESWDRKIKKPIHSGPAPQPISDLQARLNAVTKEFSRLDSRPQPAIEETIEGSSNVANQEEIVEESLNAANKEDIIQKFIEGNAVLNRVLNLELSQRGQSLSNSSRSFNSMNFTQDVGINHSLESIAKNLSELRELI